MTNLLLLNVPITDLKNQILFSNSTAQENYFKSKKITNELDNENFSYIEQENLLKVPFAKEEIYNCNYIMYQNLNYSEKWHYCFVTSLKYENDGLTYLTIKEDVFQTWFLECTIHPCFVEREHVHDDTIGANTVEENLNIGEVEQESYNEFLNLGQDGNDYYFCINTTYDPIAEKDFEGVSKVNGNLIGSYIFCFNVYSGSVGITDVTNFIYKTNQDAKIDAIQDLYILPKTLIDNIGTTTKTHSATTGSFECKLLNTSSDVLTISMPFTKTHSFSNFTPKNNKILCYPYNYLLVSNNCGNINTYKYEDFTQANPIFDIEMAVSIGGSIRLVPREYKKIDHNYDESLPLAKFPTCSWSSDAFINWLTTNAINVGTQVVATGATAIAGDRMSVSNSINNVANLIGQFRQALLLPNIQGGNNNGDVNFSARKNTFSVYHMRAKIEYLRIIDDFFSEFGYKINRVKIPETHSRENWNYIKTIDINITGNVPLYAIEELKEMFDNGCTLWHNASNIFNYNLSNNII